MNRSVRAAVVGLALLASAAAFAQSPELKALWQQSGELYGQGRFKDAIAPAEQAVQKSAAEFGASHPVVAYSLLNLGRAYREAGRLGEAEAVLRRGLAINEQALGPNHVQVAVALNQLALLYEQRGRFDDAEPLYRRALAIRQTTDGPEHPATATVYNNLGALYRAQGRYTEAEAAFRRALEIREKALGPEHREVAAGLNNLGEMYRQMGRYAEAEPLLTRALDVWEKTLGPAHPSVAATLNNLAELYRAQGRYSEAEAPLKRALAIREQAVGLEHPDVALSLNNLAALYRAQGRYAEAEPLYRRSLSIREKAFGPEHPDVARTVNNMARVYRAQRRYAEAEPLFRRALAIWEKALGPDHPDVGFTLDNLARVYRAQGRFDEAEPLFRRSLDIWEKAFGPDHPEIARAINSLADLYQALQRYDDSEALFRRSLAIWQTALGPGHPSVAQGHENLAGLYLAAGRGREALASIRQATAILRDRAARVEEQRSEGAATEQKAQRDAFLLHVAAVEQVASGDEAARAALTGEGFEVAQLAQATGAARAVARMAARFATGTDAMAALVRERQDAVEDWKRLDQKLVRAASLPPARRDLAAEADLRARLAGLDGRLATLDQRLHAEFPRYAEIAGAQPVAQAQAQALLRADEALVQYLVAEDASYAWVLRRDRAQLLRLPVGRRAMDAAVTTLRSGLDASRLVIEKASDIPAFDLGTAWRAYERLFWPLEPALEGARHVYIVPDGALQSLPLGVLVTAPPAGRASDFADYRKVRWLADRYAMTVLPSVSSLAALRGFAGAAAAGRRPFLGVGNPVLEGRGGPRPAIRATGPQAVAEAVRRLDPLPDSAAELGRLAAALGAGPDQLLLGPQANEKRLRAAALADYRVVAFATHGLVAGDLQGVAEPALVLTPPAKADAEDDGVLTASEIAGLKLNAEWIVLSACNTAADDGTPGADGLSGLAKAFFYAGSRALLVSHWPVDSESAVKLTTGAFAALAAEPGIGRAQALQRSMRALAADPGSARFAHPMFWAPFVIVGDGGAGG